MYVVCYGQPKVPAAPWQPTNAIGVRRVPIDQRGTAHGLPPRKSLVGHAMKTHANALGTWPHVLSLTCCPHTLYTLPVHLPFYSPYFLPANFVGEKGTRYSAELLLGEPKDNNTTPLALTHFVLFFCHFTTYKCPLLFL